MLYLKKTINYWISKSKKGIDISVDHRPCNTDRKSKTDNENYKDYDLQKVDLSKNIANVKSDSFLNFIWKQYSEQAFTNMFF